MKLRSLVLIAVALALLVHAGVNAQDPTPSFRAEWAACEGRVLEVSKALTEAQPFRAQAVNGTLVDRASTVIAAQKGAEDRLVALYAKANPGKALDPKTGKVSDTAPPGNGKGGQ